MFSMKTFKIPNFLVFSLFYFKTHILMIHKGEVHFQHFGNFYKS